MWLVSQIENDVHCDRENDCYSGTFWPVPMDTDVMTPAGEQGPWACLWSIRLMYISHCDKGRDPDSHCMLGSWEWMASLYDVCKIVMHVGHIMLSLQAREGR